VELLIVLLIIGLVSTLVLPVVLSSLAEREINEAARLLQASLAGARDSAIHRNAPSGIRLLPDPIFNGVNPSTGLLDPAWPLAASQFIPIEPAPDYSEGLVSIIAPYARMKVPYPGPGGGNYPLFVPNANVLLIEESVFQPDANPAILIPNPPVSWFWNIRVGDRIQVNRSGPWYVVVGPMTVRPADGNPEMFVNVGPPGPPDPRTYPLVRMASDYKTLYHPEFLFLVNTRDDNSNGWIDEGWDGVDNNGDGNIDELAEWEDEHWPQAVATQVTVNQPYTIRRRPAPAPNARAVALPTNIVIDLTTWSSTRERSRLPVNPYSGQVDILVNPAGDVVPSTIYGSPASFGMASAFFHFWLAERSDLTAPATSTTPPLLPIPPTTGPSQLGRQPLSGQYRLATLFTRTGLLTTNASMRFDDPAAPANGATYSPNLPFLEAQQGVNGGP
jgi:type II secretory pathway pseudopilin PulG